MKIYLDNCCFNRPFDSQASLRVRLESEAKLAIQEEILQKKVTLVWSYILDFENRANPFRERRETIQEWKAMAGERLGESPDLLRFAQELEKLGLRSKDCLHLACAITAGCDIFLTTDDGILKKRTEISRIRVLNPVDYYTGEPT